ncbi:MAG: hypothetical protein ABIR06_04220 [Cyclobacteriaceae bacterium]
MKIDLKTLAAKKYIAKNKGGDYYAPVKDFIVMIEETPIAFLNFDLMEDIRVRTSCSARVIKIIYLFLLQTSRTVRQLTMLVVILNSEFQPMTRW